MSSDTQARQIRPVLPSDKLLPLNSQPSRAFSNLLNCAAAADRLQVDARLCINNCSGNGQCVGGFCLCRRGFFGRDCSRDKAGFTRPPEWPHMRGGVTGDQLKVYIYELPVQLASRQWGESNPIYYASYAFSEVSV